MADHFTNRLALPYPDIDDPADVPADMQQLAERLDLLIPAGSGGGLVLNRVTVGDVGMAGQVRAGRALTAADFTALGLSAPRGLWNLSDLSDASGNGRALTNKGGVTFAPGINGIAATAAQFTGSAAQALYIADTGAADPFRIGTGSWGCWLRTAKRGTEQGTLSKWGATGGLSWWLGVSAANLAKVYMSSIGTDLSNFVGVSDVCDDRWHCVIVTHDGTVARLYVDGALEANLAFAAPMFGGASPLNIGASTADAGTAAGSSHFGRVDEAFVTADVLSDDQVRNLYCAKLAHGYGAIPSGIKLNVTRRKRGGAWAVGDFPAQPLRLHNFTAASLADQGSNNTALTNTFPALIVPVAGADGVSSGGLSFGGAHQGIGSTDAGMPVGLSARSYGCWFKTGASLVAGIIAWGTYGHAEIITLTTGQVRLDSGADLIVGPFVCDGQWHCVVVVEDNAAGDGIKRKGYIDGRLIGGSTALGAITLAGAGKFRLGSTSDGANPFTGQIDGAFVSDAAFTYVQVAALWAKGSQALLPSPKNPGDHVEAWDAAAVYATFDGLETNAQVDLGVAA
jgi:hypothetical protein